MISYLKFLEIIFNRFFSDENVRSSFYVRVRNYVLEKSFNYSSLNTVLLKMDNSMMSLSSDKVIDGAAGEKNEIYFEDFAADFER